MELQWGERSFVDVDGVSVHVEWRGGDVPSLALLHGFASGTYTWAGFADTLAGPRLLAWDRPPFGRSERPAPSVGPGDPYGPAAVQARAGAVMAAFDVHRPVLVGHSQGCLVAARMVRAGVDVAGLVLIAPAIEGAPPSLIRRSTTFPGADAVGPRAVKAALWGIHPTVKALRRQRSDWLDATAIETTRLLRRPGTAEALWHLTSTFEPTQVDDVLDHPGVPTIVIGGADDRICPPELTERVADRLGVEAHILDHVGHAAHQQVPEQVVELLGGVLDA